MVKRQGHPTRDGAPFCVTTHQILPRWTFSWLRPSASTCSMLSSSSSLFRTRHFAPRPTPIISKKAIGQLDPAPHCFQSRCHRWHKTTQDLVSGIAREDVDPGEWELDELLPSLFDPLGEA